MKASEQYFPVVLFIMLYKVALTFESVETILKCGHSNDTGGDNSNKACFGGKTKFFRESGDFARNRETPVFFQKI